MEFKIAPQEGPHVADSNQFVIRTRVPYGEITDAMVSQRCIAAGLTVGDSVVVQSYNHELDTLLHETEFRVYQKTSELKMISTNDRDQRQVNQVTMAVARLRPWWSSPAGAAVEAAERELLGATEELRVQWNPGKKMHQVFRGETLVAENTDKDAALQEAEGA